MFARNCITANSTAAAARCRRTGPAADAAGLTNLRRRLQRTFSQ